MPSLSSKNKKKLKKLTDFEQLVLQAAFLVPKGKVVTYGQIARKIGRPKSSRAVGNALNKNPCAPEIPCHRVVREGGILGGFASGKTKKAQLLKKEGIKIKRDKVVDFSKIKYRFK